MRDSANVREDFWLASVDSGERHNWEGLAFERICLWHARQIKEALRIGGVQTNMAAWRSARKSGGAQVDLVIDRKDGVINLCEMKFTSALFAIGAGYEKELRNKVAMFREETGTKSSIHLTMVTVDGVRRNEYAGIVQSEVTLDDLFDR